MPFPSLPFRAVELVSNTPTIVNKSLSGVENRSQVAAQYWSFTAVFENLTDSQRRELWGFLMSNRGNLNSFTISLPDTLNDTGSSYSSTITSVNGSSGALSATGTVTSNNTLIVKAGDFIKFNNHSKLYMVTADATSNGSGSVTISFFPALRTAVSSGSITYNAVEMTVRCTNQNFANAISLDMYSSFNLDFEEVF